MGSDKFTVFPGIIENIAANSTVDTVAKDVAEKPAIADAFDEENKDGSVNELIETASGDSMIADAEITPGARKENSEANQIQSQEKVIEIDPREKELLADLNRARKEFVEMDCKKTNMRDRVNSYFKKGRLELNETVGRKIEGGSGEMANVADDEDVTYMQALYDNALINYKNARIDNLQKKGFAEEELTEEFKKLALEIGNLERMSLIDEKLEVKASEMQGTALETGKNMFQKSVGWYKKLGLKKQMLITVGLVAGAGAAALGAAAGVAGGATLASCFAAATLGRRVLGGASTGVGVFGMAEGGAKIARNISAKKEANIVVAGEFSQAEIEVLRKQELRDSSEEQRAEILSREISKDERFNIVKSRMDRIAFEGNDSVEDQRINTLFRATGATAIGALVGSGVLTHWISEKTGLGDKIHSLLEQGKHTQVGQMIMEKLGMVEHIAAPENATSTPKPESVVAAAAKAKGLDLNPKDFVTPDGHNIPPAVGVDTPNLNAFDHPNGGPVNFVEGGKVPPVQVGFSDNLHTTSATESLRIEKGSSIEKTLIDHFRKIHPEMKNPGAAAHRMWLDYMHDNKAELVKKMGESEYAKTLKDGMVNVKAGTKLILDEHDPLKIKLHDIGGKISHLNVGEHAHAATTNLPPTPEYVVSSAKPFEKVVDGLRSDDVLKNQIHSAPPAEKVLSTDDVQRIVNEKMYRADEAEYSRLRQYLAGSQDKIKSLEAARRELLLRNQNIEGVEWDHNASEIGKLNNEISGIEHNMNDNQHRLDELKQKGKEYVENILKADKLNQEAMEHAEKLKVAPAPEVTPSAEAAPAPEVTSPAELRSEVGKSFSDALKNTDPKKFNENVAKWMSGEFQKSGVSLDKVSKMGYEEAIKSDVRVKMAFMRVFECYKDQIGARNAAIQSGRGETIGKWMERIGRLYDMKRSGMHV